MLSKYIDKIGFAIEDEYGRLQPAVVEMEEFFSNRDNYVNRIEQKEVHFVERNVSRLIDIIDHKEIQKALEQGEQILIATYFYYLFKLIILFINITLNFYYSFICLFLGSRKKKAPSVPRHPPPANFIPYDEFDMEDSRPNFNMSMVLHMDGNREEPERKTTYTERHAARQERRFAEYIDKQTIQQKIDRSAAHKRSPDLNRSSHRRRSPDRRRSPFREHSRERYRSRSREYKDFQSPDSDTDRRYNDSQPNQDINAIYR